MIETDVAAIENCILDKDGSCRDITMDDVDVQAAREIVSFLLRSYTLTHSINREGDELAHGATIVSIEKEFAKAENTLFIYLESSADLISRLLVTLHWLNLQEVSCELTFFPEDVRRPFSLSLFKEFLEPILEIAQPDGYFVRYENASWAYGDTSKEGGMIYWERRA
ncbi:MAG: hypothetical protein ABL994_18860 [Verrucomicrobiales bacterium]